LYGSHRFEFTACIEKNELAEREMPSRSGSQKRKLKPKEARDSAAVLKFYCTVDETVNYPQKFPWVLDPLPNAYNQGRPSRLVQEYFIG
jgi:hypothetical protein